MNHSLAVAFTKTYGKLEVVLVFLHFLVKVFENAFKKQVDKF